MLDLTTIRSIQTRILTLRGQANQVAGWLDWLESTTREAAVTDYSIANLGASALARAELGQGESAATLLSEVASAHSARSSSYYACYLPAMVRTAVSIGSHQLAERLAADVEPRYAIAEHALTTTTAALCETHGRLEAAADGYADAAQRWQTFGVVPEQAFALLGQGRCLLALGQHTEATQALQQARAIFQTLQAAPAFSETDQLLQQANALSA